MGDNGGMKPGMTDDSATSVRRPHFLRHFLIGFFTVAPLWITWLVFDFLFSLLARAGAPFMWGVARLVRPFSETLAGWLLSPAVQYVLAACFAVAGLYALGLLASVVIGRRLIEWFERLLGRLPLVHTIYGGTKRFLQSLRKPPVSGQRVVLISFPSPEMKAVGFVTKVMRDEASGRPAHLTPAPRAVASGDDAAKGKGRGGRGKSVAAGRRARAVGPVATPVPTKPSDSSSAEADGRIRCATVVITVL